jgi:hypothetical protein
MPCITTAFIAPGASAIDRGNYVVLKAVATGGRKELLSFFDYGVSRDYVAEVVISMSELSKQSVKLWWGVSRLGQSKSSQLKAWATGSGAKALQGMATSLIDLHGSAFKLLTTLFTLL